MEEKRHTSAEYERELQEIKDGLIYLGGLTEKALEKGVPRAYGERLRTGAEDRLRRRPDRPARHCTGGEVHPSIGPEAARGARSTLHHDGDQDHRPPGAHRGHGGHIAEKVLILNDLPQIKPYIDLPRMAEIARGMIRKSLDALVRGDVDLAQRVREEDTVIDQLNDQIFRELLTFMMEDPHKIQVCLYIMQISKNLERIADHAEGIADMVIYMVTGKSVRHQPTCAEKE